MDIKMYFFLFLIYAITGWIIEVIGGLISNKKFVNRGFLIGPYCPIYGVGGVLITIFLEKYYSDPIILFCVAIVICGILEYLTSYIMEKVFKARWWDYKNKKFNINGRVCLETIIPFGLLGCFIIYISNPCIFKLLNNMPSNVLNISFYICVSIFILDFIISFFIISRLRKTVKEVKNDKSYDNTEEITNKVREILSNKSIFDRRLINAFPRISIEKVKQEIKKKTVEVKENVSKVKDEATQKIKQSAIKVKENSIKIKVEATKKIKKGTSKVKQSDK